jgi:hypothetical protein
METYGIRRSVEGERMDWNHRLGARSREILREWRETYGKAKTNGKSA